jgi:polar amino acid transport system substrate-binding protein
MQRLLILLLAAVLWGASSYAWPVGGAVHSAEDSDTVKGSRKLPPHNLLPTRFDNDAVEKMNLLENLSEAQRAWLKAHRDIRLGVDPAWPPFEYIDETGIYQGIVSDIIQILNQQLQIEMRPVAGLSWSEVMQGVRAGNIDVLPCAVKTPARSEYLLFTQPYLKFPMVVLTRSEAPFIESIENFISLKVMVVKNYASHEIIQQDYPELNLHLAETIDDALKALSKGKVDAFVGNLASITYTVKKLKLTDLKVASTTPYSFELSFAVRKDWPELVPILNQSLAAIPNSIRTKVLNDWINIRFERHIDWYLVGQIVTMVVVTSGFILIVILSWNRALAREVKERAKTEGALRKSEERIRTIFNNANVGMVMFDRQGRLVQANACLIRMFGYSSDALRRLPPQELVYPDDRHDSQQRFEALLQGEPSNFRVEQRFVRKDASVFWGDLSVAAVYDEAGDIQSVIGMLVNITERKTAELDMRKLWRAIEEGSTAIMITDRKGSIEYVNPRFTEITGFSSADAIGQTFKIIESDRHPPAFYQEIQQTIGLGQEWRGEVQYRRQNGDIYWSLTRISPVRDEEGLITHFISAQDDITEQKRMDEELIQAKQTADQASKAKSEFLANMSHEIRTPMNAIIGLTHLALKTNLTTKQQDYLSKIQSSADALLMIINDILDFSKIEAGKLSMESVDFNLDEVLGNLSNLITVKTQDKENLEVLYDIKQDVPRSLVGDPLRLGQVLINLGSNAIKFTPSGEIILSIELQDLDDQKVTLKFSVSDTGIGMSQTQIDQLFTAFTQADTSTTRKFGGTGLGLTISQRLVHMMQGRIWAESQPDQGSRFSFTATFGLGQEPDRCSITAMAGLKKTRILVVDDHDITRQIFQEMLSTSCLQVNSVSSGAEALAELEHAAAAAPYQVVLMDWKMPHMDGLEATRRIKNHPLLQPVPVVIMVTHYHREELIQRSEEIGIDDFLVKPVSPDLMMKTIFKALQAAEFTFGSEDRLAAPSPETASVLLGLKLLLVEDNEINQQVAVEILENAGADVEIAENGAIALALLQSHGYDAVLMDIQMPVMDGYEATRNIRKEKRFQSLPIIAMTAHAMTGDREKSLAAGMNDHIAKPIEPAQLFATLHRWIPRDPRTDAATVSVKPEKTSAFSSAAVDDLPESLPGFNFAEGLQRLQGNRSLYKKLLLDFAIKYGDILKNIRQALDADSLQTAHQLIHSLKGMAGSLAAVELQQAAMQLEKIIKPAAEQHLPPPDDIENRYAKLLHAFDAAITSIQSLQPGAASAFHAPAASDSTLPAALAQPIADGLQRAANIGDIDDIIAIAEKLKSHNQPALAEKVIQMAEEFDFDGIIKLVAQIKNTPPD